MKDIRSLYRNAKYSGREADISSYREAVQELLENSPVDYILQLEYIIQSDIGLSTVNQFFEKYGLCIPVCEYLKEAAEECCEKAKEKKVNSKPYEDLVEVLEQYQKQYQECFTMFGFYVPDNEKLVKEYVETYYSNTNGKQNRFLLNGMIQKFGECAIPDLMITANQLGEKSVIMLMNEVSHQSDLLNPTFCECVAMALQNMNLPTYMEQTMNWFKDRSLEPMIESMRTRTQKEYRESVIMGDFDGNVKYTAEDVAAIHDMISLKEYAVLNESDDAKAVQMQQDIYHLYEELDGMVSESGDIKLEEDVADSVIPMLPTSAPKQMTEDLSWANTINKKKGTVPGYLGDNHELASIGEEDPDAEKEKNPEEYRRPSADKNTKKPESDPLEDEEEPNEEDLTDDEDKKDKKKSEIPNGINNYYYYTYTNSLNRNQNSFNKGNDYSQKDDHSHRSYQTINHGDQKSDKKEEDDYKKLESVDVTKNDGRPESDHPIRDTMMDLDRKAAGVQQKIKKGAQTAIQAGKAIVKPIKRADLWISKLIGHFKDKNENQIKEELADPHARKNIYSAIKKCIINGSLMKAGLLLNPLFIFMRVAKTRKTMRIRNEMIGEIKTEIAICEEKIKDADNTPEGRRDKYKLMRFKNELNKKLLRVGGSKGMNKIL